VRLLALVNPPLLVGVRVTVPATVGLIVNVLADDVPDQISVVAERPDEPVPDGVIVIVPVYVSFGITVKLDEEL
jgi:hypothetical protein